MFNFLNILILSLISAQLILITFNKITIKNLFLGILINLSLFTLLIKLTLISIESYFFLMCFFFFIALDIILAFVIILNKFYIKKII